MLKGIDISHHQKGINIEATGVDFVIIKATEGVGYIDECCDTFYQQAKASGKKLGVYHFARPDLGNSAEAEADYFVNNIKGYIKEAILVLDWEPAKGQIANTTWAKKWLDRVYSRTGVKPLIYMSASPMRTYKWQDVANADYGLWVANYGVNDGVDHDSVFNRYPLANWTFYALWQYSSKGRVNGYNGNVDVNYFSGDGIAWDKYAGKNSNEEETSKKKTIDELAREVIEDKWGTAETTPTRKERLEAEGYNYQEVQNRVNEILDINKTEQKYIVKSGDTLIRIASKFGTTYQKIAKDNNIADPNKIYAGQTLIIK